MLKWVSCFETVEEHAVSFRTDGCQKADFNVLKGAPIILKHMLKEPDRLV